MQISYSGACDSSFDSMQEDDELNKTLTQCGNIKEARITWDRGLF